jgi:hypothetical protein
MAHSDGGRVDAVKLTAALDEVLGKKYGNKSLVVAQSAPNFHLDYIAIDKLGLAHKDVEDAAAQFLLGQEGVAEVFTRSRLESGAASATRLDLLMQRAWNRERSGDLMVVTRPYWYFGSSGDIHDPAHHGEVADKGREFYRARFSETGCRFGVGFIADTMP